MSDWVHDLAVAFARRCRQEAEMQEQNWFVAHPEVMRFILKHEQAQELIGRMCAAPLVIQYNEQGEELHTADRPFCRDMRCECHFDSELWQTYIYQPWLDGILTIDAGAALFSGRQV